MPGSQGVTSSPVLPFLEYSTHLGAPCAVRTAALGGCPPSVILSTRRLRPVAWRGLPSSPHPPGQPLPFLPV